MTTQPTRVKCDYCNRSMRKVKWRATAYIAIGEAVKINEGDSIGPTCRKNLIKRGADKHSFEEVKP